MSSTSEKTRIHPFLAYEAQRNTWALTIFGISFAGPACSAALMAGLRGSARWHLLCPTLERAGPCLLHVPCDPDRVFLSPLRGSSRTLHLPAGGCLTLTGSDTTRFSQVPVLNILLVVIINLNPNISSSKLQSLPLGK